MSEENNNIFYDNALLRAVEDRKSNRDPSKVSGTFVDVAAINQLAELLVKNRQTEQLEVVQGLVDTINTIEKALNVAMAELQSVKSQLHKQQLPTSSVKNKVLEDVQQLESGLKKLKNQLNLIKHKFATTAQNVVDAIKEKGVSALDKTSEFMSLKENLTVLNTGIRNNISQVNKNINTINSMTQELNAATKHIKNIGRAMTGKERDGDMAQASANMVKPLQAVKKMLVAMERKSANSVEKIEALSKRAGREQRPSVLKQLKEEKAKPIEPTTDKPRAKEMAL